MVKTRKGEPITLGASHGIGEPFLKVVKEAFGSSVTTVLRQACDVLLERHHIGSDEGTSALELKARSKFSSLKVKYRKTGQLTKHK